MGQQSKFEIPAPPTMTEKARVKGLLEVGHNCIWSISTCKPGYGVNNLRDDSIETYWQ